MKIENLSHSKHSQENNLKEIRKVAELYENQFLREMVKEMRKTVSESELIEKNMAEKIFQGELDDEFVNLWTDRGGIGLADLIYDQIIEKFGVQMGVVKPAQPVQHKDHHQLLMKQKPTGQEKKILYEFKAPKNSSILSPWNGEIKSIGSLGDQNSFIKIDHDNGIQSTLVYSGSKSRVSGKINKGDLIGQTHDFNPSVMWMMNQIPFHSEKTKG